MKKVFAIVLAAALVLALTGCNSSDYKKAQELYETGEYDEALEIFQELEQKEYKDSADMVTACQYSIAAELMYEEQYDEAIAAFEDLGDYMDSAELIKKCIYEKGVSLYEQENYAEARSCFEQVADYKDAETYIQDVKWYALRDHILTEGEPTSTGSTTYFLSQQYGKYTLYLGADKDEKDTLIILSAYATNLQIATFNYDFAIILKKGEAMAEFEANSNMELISNGRKGTNEEIYKGMIDPAQCNGSDTLVLSEYSKYAVNIYGGVTTSTDIATAPTQDLHTHYHDMQQNMAQFVAGLNLGITLKDFGFVNLGE